MFNAIDAGSTMVYGAMFDEVDEGTAVFKTVAKTSDLPSTGTFLALDADGADLPNDWYMRLAGAATEVLRGQRRLSETIPLQP